MTRTQDAVDHFRAKLRFETDPADVSTARLAGEPLVLIDTRSQTAWNQGHAVGAVHIPTRELAERAPREIPADAEVVVYCWGPGCNGATKAALELSLLGYRVRELIGGFEYWAREGYAVADVDGAVPARRDPLTTPLVPPASAVACDC